ncbi:MAG: HAMP domain-containing sensor histidine kinase [Acidobacteriota bacterium]
MRHYPGLLRHLPPVRLRSIFLFVAVLILGMPSGGVVLLRLYESALIRRTESELLAQGAFIAAAHAAELERQASPTQIASFGVPLTERGADWHPVVGARMRGRLDRLDPGEPFHPLRAELSLRRDPVLPGAPDPEPADGEPLAFELAAGRALEPVLIAGQRRTLAGLRIVDPQGRVVASTGDGHGLSLLHREGVRHALAGHPVSLLRARDEMDRHPLTSASRNTWLRVVVAVPIVRDGRSWGAVLLQRTPESVQKSLHAIRHEIIAGLIVVLGIATLVSVLTSRLVSGPVQELVVRAEDVVAGRKRRVAPLERPGTVELERLSRAYSELTEALARRSEVVDAFAAHVSHEFKTPLTALRGAVELLRDHGDDMEPEQRERFLRNVDVDARRLERLLARLLTLTRADLATPSSERSELGEVARALEERDELAPLQVRLEGMPSVLMPREALVAVLEQLLSNARRHAGTEATVSLEARAEARDGSDGVAIDVVDDGPGIRADRLERIFEPFFSTSTDEGGTGLGLSIARALVSSHGGSLEVSSRPGRTTFTAWLPA